MIINHTFQRLLIAMFRIRTPGRRIYTKWWPEKICPSILILFTLKWPPNSCSLVGKTKYVKSFSFRYRKLTICNNGDSQHLFWKRQICVHNI